VGQGWVARDLFSDGHWVKYCGTRLEYEVLCERTVASYMQLVLLVKEPRFDKNDVKTEVGDPTRTTV
jgi:hypothetical protein